LLLIRSEEKNFIPVSVWLFKEMGVIMGETMRN
jgi:hypothetical protein